MVYLVVIWGFNVVTLFCFPFVNSIFPGNKISKRRALWELWVDGKSSGMCIIERRNRFELSRFDCEEIASQNWTKYLAILGGRGSESIISNSTFTDRVGILRSASYSKQPDWSFESVWFEFCANVKEGLSEKNARSMVRHDWLESQSRWRDS